MIELILFTITNYISYYVDAFNVYAKEYPFVAGALAVWLLGAGTYLCRDIPSKIISLVLKFSTTTVTMSNSSQVFYQFLKWYEKQGYAKEGRYLKIHNGSGYSGNVIASLGYGNHYFWFNRRLIKLVMTKTEVPGSSKEFDSIEMVSVGRSHKVFNDIVKEVSKKDKEDDKLKINKYSDSYWNRLSDQRPRHLNTIFLSKGVKEKLKKHLEDFLSRESWYLEKGLPYQTGILLYGPPGTGKTSIIKSLAKEIGYDIHILSASSLSYIENAISELPEKALLVVEDIDTSSMVKKRKDVNDDEQVNKSTSTEQKKEDTNLSGTLLDEISRASLSDLLNALDGVHTVHGRILVTTTNYIDKLDSALIRPGRIDLKIKIDYADVHVVRQFFNNFYSEYTLPTSFIVKEKLSSSNIQQIILENLENPSEVFRQVTKG